MMVSLKDIARVVDGLSLVLKENIGCWKSSPLETVIRTAVLSATDVAGLTKGKIRSLETHKPHIDSSDDSHRDASSSISSSSVVYFTDDKSMPDVLPHILPTESQAIRLGASVDPESTPDVLPQIAPTSEFQTIRLDRDVSQTLVDADESPTSIAAPMNFGKQRNHRERRVPSTPFSRAIGFAGLGAGLAWGTLQESAKRIVFGTPNSENHQHSLSPFLSERNAERLALALCRMRGAALKLGQMLSIQDESLVPAPILAALEIVRQGADRMPRNQLNQVLEVELGSNWSSKLMSFDYEPMAAASIGQYDLD
ncbi:hypothetical protein OROGR_019173 [Orobanche gracilis]